MRITVQQGAAKATATIHTQGSRNQTVTPEQQAAMDEIARRRAALAQAKASANPTAVDRDLQILNAERLGDQMIATGRAFLVGSRNK